MITQRLIAGVPNRFYWQPKIGKPTGGVSLSVAGLGIAGKALTPLLASKTITAVDGDLRTLTLSAPAAASIGGTGRMGEVFVDLGIAGRYRAHVEAFVGDSTIRLATALPLAEGVAPDAGSSTMSISWLTYFVDLTAEDVGAVVARRQRWSISWTRDLGSVNDEPTVDRGLLDVVMQIPDTGLTHGLLLEGAAHLAGLVPSGQESYEPQIRAGLGKLIRWVKRRLEPGQYVDQVDFGQYIGVHRHLVLANLAEDKALSGFGGLETATYHNEQAREGFKDLPAIEWIDTDDDGVVDSGETDVAPNVFEPLGSGLEPEVKAGAADPWDLSRKPWEQL